MGAWGVEPWDSDEAADWFGVFFKGCDLTPIKACLDHFNPLDEIQYDQIRAACYLLQCFAKPYLWPHDARVGDAKELLAKGIATLGNMIHPPDAQWSFLEMWDGNDKGISSAVNHKVITSVEKQIAELKDRLSEWKG